MSKIDFCIDCHCHMFTMADIPLYRTMEQAVADHSNFGTYAVLFFVLFLDKKKKVRGRRVDSPPRVNIEKGKYLHILIRSTQEGVRCQT